MNRIKVAIIGVGNLGKRHAQSAEKNQNVTEVLLIDPYFKTEETINNFSDTNEMSSPKYQFCSDIDTVAGSNHINILIIATNSVVRKKVFEETLEKFSVDTVIFEKVAFTLQSEWDFVSNICKERNIKALVNCPRRYFDHYKEIKEKLDKSLPIKMTVTGSKWGLACNSIHLIDLFQYLSNAKLKVANLNLDDEIMESKRNGYIELSGSIDIKTDKGDYLFLDCSTDKAPFMNVYIENEDFKVEVRESEGAVIHQPIKYKSYYQSDLTNKYIDDILAGNCGLTDIEDSEIAHMSFMTPLNSFLQLKALIKPNNILPIT